jgi:hypothetical protein
MVVELVVHLVEVVAQDHLVLTGIQKGQLLHAQEIQEVQEEDEVRMVLVLQLVAVVVQEVIT